MDAVLTSVMSSVPQLGVGGVALAFIVLLLRRESSSQDRFSAEYKRINEAHNAELAELRAEIQSLRERIEDLQLKLDIEREERRKAEDVAAAIRREYRGLPCDDSFK